MKREKLYKIYIFCESVTIYFYLVFIPLTCPQHGAYPRMTRVFMFFLTNIFLIFPPLSLRANDSECSNPVIMLFFTKIYKIFVILDPESRTQVIVPFYTKAKITGLPRFARNDKALKNAPTGHFFIQSYFIQPISNR